MAENLACGYLQYIEEATPMPLNIYPEVEKPSEKWVWEELPITPYEKVILKAHVVLPLKSSKFSEREAITPSYEAYLRLLPAVRKQTEELEKLSLELSASRVLETLEFPRLDLRRSEAVQWHIRSRQQVPQAQAESERGWRYHLTEQLGPWGLATIFVGIGCIVRGLMVGTWPLVLLGGTMSAITLMQAFIRSGKEHTRKSSYHTPLSTTTRLY